MTTLNQPFTSLGPSFQSSPYLNADPGEYVNAVQIRVSLWEITLDLLHAFAPPLQQTVTPQTMTKIVARTVMSPQHAKALAVALTRTVEAWTAEHGELPDVDDIVGGMIRADVTDTTQTVETSEEEGSPE